VFLLVSAAPWPIRGQTPIRRAPSGVKGKPSIRRLPVLCQADRWQYTDARGRIVNTYCDYYPETTGLRLPWATIHPVDFPRAQRRPMPELD